MQIVTLYEREEAKEQFLTPERRVPLASGGCNRPVAG